MRRHPRRFAGLSTALALAVALTACAQEADGSLTATDDPATSEDDTAGQSGSDDTTTTSDTIEWEDCGSAECGTLEGCESRMDFNGTRPPTD